MGGQLTSHSNRDIISIRKEVCLMVRYIEIPKSVHCPKWKIDICLYGKYYLSDNMDSGVGKFKSASCPIVENSKLPLHKQEKEYKLFRCLEYLQCELLKDFPEEINVQKVTRIE